MKYNEQQTFNYLPKCIEDTPLAVFQLNVLDVSSDYGLVVNRLRLPAFW